MYAVLRRDNQTARVELSLDNRVVTLSGTPRDRAWRYGASRAGVSRFFITLRELIRQGWTLQAGDYAGKEIN